MCSCVIAPVGSDILKLKETACFDQSIYRRTSPPCGLAFFMFLGLLGDVPNKVPSVASLALISLYFLATRALGRLERATVQIVASQAAPCSLTLGEGAHCVLTSHSGTMSAFSMKSF